MSQESNFPIMVSVICLAYNHEKYIQKALDSILEQKTTFRFEIVVHDDKSTDGTTKIIEEYARKFPKLIVPIYEQENQYSRGNQVSKIAFSKCSGKYIAFCECDDYWCDNNKLQCQVEFLENNLEYSACSSSCLVLNNITNELTELFHVETDIDLSIRDIVEWDKHHYQTASLMLRREYAIVPDEFFIKGVGDYPRALYLRKNGKIRYFHKNMTVYRAFTEGSWSINFSKNTSMQRDLVNNTLCMLKIVVNILPEDFKQPVSEKIRLLEYQSNLYDNNYPVLKREYKEYFYKLSYYMRLKIKMKYYFPSLYLLLKKYVGTRQMKNNGI